MKTVVINLLGGSGLGKSTTAALLFGEMKLLEMDVELVREFVKEWAWQGRAVGPFGQGILYGHQMERESSLYGKVEYIITDSPLLLCPVYQLHYEGQESIKSQVLSDMRKARDLGVIHVNFLLQRHKPFNPKGRYETAEQAKTIDGKVKSFLDNNNINYVLVNQPDTQRVKFIVDYAKDTLNQIQGDSGVRDQM